MAGEKEGVLEGGRDGCGGLEAGSSADMRASAACDSDSVGSGSMSGVG